MSETNIPSEIKEKIDEEYPIINRPVRDIQTESGFVTKDMNANERKACKYGYLLASKTIYEIKAEGERLLSMKYDDEIKLRQIIDEKGEEIKRLKEVIHEAGKTVNQQASTIAALTAENEGNKEIARARGEAINELQAEIERLKGLIDDLLETGYSGLEHEHEKKEFIGKFKTENNI